MKMKNSPPLVLAMSLFVSGCAGLPIDITEPTGGDSRELDRSTIVAGLKEALRIGSERAIGRASAIDGFLANELIRVTIPEELQSMARALRTVGLGKSVDELEVAMNRAAEEAVGEAREVLWREVRALTIPDAIGILRGGSTAATDYFRQRTSNEIRRRFHPIVVTKMDAVGLSRLYGDLAERYNELPFVTRPALDLDEYVTDKALGGLFTVLGEEEAKIRANPIARTTELLRRVFGAL